MSKIKTSLMEEELKDYEIIQFNNGKYALKKISSNECVDIKKLKKGKIKTWSIFWNDYCTADSIKEIKNVIKKGFHLIKKEEEKRAKRIHDWTVNKKIDVSLTDAEEVKALKEVNNKKDRTIKKMVKELNALNNQDKESIKLKIKKCGNCLHYSSQIGYCVLLDKNFSPEDNKDCNEFISISSDKSKRKKCFLVRLFNKKDE